MNTRFVAAYHRLGLLVWLSLGSSSIAALQHHYSRLPSSYTWFEPVWTLRRVLRMPRFPWAMIGVYVLGAWAWRGGWAIEQSARNLARSLPIRELRTRALRPLLCIAAVGFVDAFILGSDRDLVDVFALIAIGFALSVHRPTRGALARELGYGALSATVFLVVCYAYTISKALAFSRGTSLDAELLNLEQALFHVPPHRVLAHWSSAHLAAAQVLDWVYFHFFEHMALTTVLLVASRKRARRIEYLAALALCYLLGGPLYRLFPARGPSYFEPRYFEYLYDPRLVSGVMRTYLQQNNDGVLAGTAVAVRTWGYVACMPSLHIAQELVMLYYSRGSRFAFLLSLVFTLLTLIAVVALGWHYSVDSLGGGVVALVAIAIAHWQRKALIPSWFGPQLDQTPPPAKAVVVPFLRAYFAARLESRAAKQ